MDVSPPLPCSPIFDSVPLLFELLPLLLLLCCMATTTILLAVMLFFP